MNMNNVKAITLPDGSKVRKIKNNNGQIIWADDTKYPYRQLEWIKFTGDQYFSLGSTWTLNKAYGINVIRDATDPNIRGTLASNNDKYNAGGWICNIQSNSQGMYFTYKAGSTTSPNYVLNDYLPNNSERTLWTYMSNNLIALEVRDANGNVIGNDEFTRSGGTWPGSEEVLIGDNLKGVKIKSLTIADATVSSGPTINVGTITSEILPCQRKSDGKLGFYIIPDNTFHPLSGTTTSANIGPTADEYPDKMIINEEPLVLYEGYYLTSHSAAKDTNYIDLGIKWNSEYKVEAYYYRPNVNSDYSRLFGTGWDTAREIQIDYPSSTGIGRLRALIGNNKDLTAYGTDTANAEYGFAVGNRGSQCEFWAYKNNDWTQASTTTWSNNIGISDHNVRLFSASQGDRDGIAGIRFLKINGPSDLWSDEGALMLLVPAKKGTKYGMYDKNNSVFYQCTTSGEGYFTITNLSGKIIA